MAESLRARGLEVVARLGQGADSTVFRIRRTVPWQGRQNFALKIGHRAAAGSTEAVAAWRREASLLAGVDHPNLVAIHEVGEIDGRPYLVMDLLDGRPLGQVLAESTLTPARVIALALDVAESLAALHRRGMIHRDLKPDNIMVLPSGECRLIDFGLATRNADRGSEAAVGTLLYCAPEQAGMLNRPVDRRSDLYSLGAVLFESLAGVPPFQAAEVGELLRMHATIPPPELTEVVAGTPAGLAAVVATLLAKDPDDRYDSAEQLAADLRRLRREPTVTQLRRAELLGVPGGPRRPLAGRRDELARLMACWQRAATGEGQVALIRGPAGGGKSRLAAELAAHVRDLGLPVLFGKCSADDPIPLAPLRAGLDAYLRACERMPADARAASYERLRAAAGSGGGLLASLTPRLGALLGDQEVTGGEDQFTLAVVDLLVALAKDAGGLLLHLDDLQWLDRGTGRVLAELPGRLAGCPLLVLGTARDGDPAGGGDPGGGAGPDAAVTALGDAVTLDLTLPPLADDGLAELVSAALPRMAADRTLVGVLATRSRGNPFVAHEYLRAIVDAGLLRPHWGTWVLDQQGLHDLELPHDALGLVLARVGQLGTRVHEVLVTAAVVGTRFRTELVAAVHGLAPDVVREHVLEAIAHGLVEPVDGGSLAFLHDRIREALRDALDEGQARQVHQRIAEALSATAPDGAGHDEVYATAHHYIAGEPATTPRQAFQACWAAGRQALDNYAPIEALAFLEHAARIDPNQQDAAFLLAHGVALAQCGQYIQARGALEQALDRATDAPTRTPILTQLADVHRSTWHHDDALAAIDLGLAELGARPPRQPALLIVSTVLMFLAALIMEWVGWRPAARQPAARRRSELIAGLHGAAAYVGVLAMRPEQVVLHKVRGLYWGNRVGDGVQYCRGQSSAGFLFTQVGMLRAARRAFARGVAGPAGARPDVRARAGHYHGGGLYLAYHDNGQLWMRETERNGQWLDLSAFGDAVGAFAMDAVLDGRTAQAQRWLALGQRRLALAPGQPTILTGVPAMVLASMGRPSAAVAALREVDEVVRSFPSSGIALIRLLATLIVLTEQDETGEPFDRAVAELEALGLPYTKMFRTHRMVEFRVAMGRLAQCRVAGERDRAARLVLGRAAVRSLGRAVKFDGQRARYQIARADLLVLEGKPERALTVCDRTPAIYDPDAPLLAFEIARVRARALIALGGSAQALRQAHAALHLTEENGWPHRAAQVTREFGLAGTRRGAPRRVARSPADAGQRPALAERMDLDAIMSSSERIGMTPEVERRRLRALQQVSVAASRILDPGVLARICLDETIRIFSADRAFLFLVDDASALVPHLGRDAAGQDVAELTGHSASLVERVRRTGEPLVVTGTDEGAALGAQSVVLHGLRSIMVAPLQLDGRLLGVVYLDSQVAKGIFNAEDVDLLVALTNHIATSMETARSAQLEISMHTARRQRDLAEALHRALQSMASTLDPDESLTRLLSCALELLPCDAGWLLRRTSPESATITLMDRDGSDSHADTTMDDSLSALLALDEPLVGTPALIPAVLRDRLATATSCLVLPLPGADGALVLASHAPDDRLDEHVGLACTLVAQGMTAYDKATLFARIQASAVTDELTGLANRRQFFFLAERDVAAAARSGRELAMLMVDIDHFKRVNDTFGHPTGDDVIRGVAHRLAGQIRTTDTIGRYGGEEFAVILPDPAHAGSTPERLRACVAEAPIETRSGPLEITISIGVTYRRPDDTMVDALLARADEALYRAKEAGRNRVHPEVPVT